jgi:DNA polymerase-3 subunit alpha
MSQFVHLNTRTTYSLLAGMPAPKALAQAAAKAGFSAMGVADTGNVFGAVETSKAFSAAGVQPILGAALYLSLNKQIFTVNLLVQNETGWQNLLHLITASNLESALEHTKAVDLPTLCSKGEGLILLTGGARFGLPAEEDIFHQLQKAFDNRLYVELQRHGLPVEQEAEPQLLRLAETLKIPTVATNESRFLEPEQAEAFNALVCIGESLTVDDPAHQFFGPAYALRSSADMLALFEDIPEATANTLAIAQRCGYWLEQVDVKSMAMPRWPVGKDERTADLIRAKAHVALEQRLQSHVFPLCDKKEEAAKRQQYTDRLEEELNVIISMGFDGYFLITSDFIRWAKDQGIPVGPGRGSGAGSLVAWCLDITDIDPIAWGLYFERFLNPERISLPDFDIDFCQERRDEVIQYVRDKYGADRVAQIITFGSLKARACIRDVGRVLQLPYGLVSRIAAFVPEGPTPPSIREVINDDERLRALAEEEAGVQELLDIAMQLEGCLRHASTHAAGLIIADQPIQDVCGLYHDPRATLPATQFSMYDAEFAGLVKFDFLGLKTLTTIRHTLDMVKNGTGEEVDMLRIPLDDAATYETLCQGYTLGVFQIESAGMTDLTRQIQPQCLEHMAAVVCLFRPGPMELMPAYVACHLGKQEPNYPHALLEPVLRETHGVAIYQEQVLRMAQVLAGFTLGEADILRRAMGKKKPKEMAAQREKFVEGCSKTNDIGEAQANAIFDTIAAFAGYGFNKAHTIAYTLISYQTAWLKTHYPLEFMAATMTLDKGNTDKLLRYKNELARMEVNLLPPDVNQSDVNFRVEGEAIRYALSAIKGAGEEAMRRLVAERTANGAYKDLWDFVERQDPHAINRKALEVLIKAGALDSLHPNRAELWENLDMLLAYTHQVWEDKTSGQNSLFGGAGTGSTNRPRPRPAPAWEPLEQLGHELTTVGFYLSAHPLASFEHELAALPDLLAINTLASLAKEGKTSAKIAGVVLSTREMKTKRGDRMGFATVSDLSGQEEVVFFPEAFARWQEQLQNQVPLVLTLAMSMEGERLRLNVDHLTSLEELARKRASLTLKVDVMEALQPLQEHLLAQPGKTACRIIVARPGEGDVTLSLPQGISCTHQLLSRISSLSGVQVLP